MRCLAGFQCSSICTGDTRTWCTSAVCCYGEFYLSLLFACDKEEDTAGFFPLLDAHSSVAPCLSKQPGFMFIFRSAALQPYKPESDCKISHMTSATHRTVHSSTKTESGSDAADQTESLHYKLISVIDLLMHFSHHVTKVNDACSRRRAGVSEIYSILKFLETARKSLF